MAEMMVRKFNSGQPCFKYIPIAIDYQLVLRKSPLLANENFFQKPNFFFKIKYWILI